RPAVDDEHVDHQSEHGDEPECRQPGKQQLRLRGGLRPRRGGRGAERRAGGGRPPHAPRAHRVQGGGRGRCWSPPARAGGGGGRAPEPATEPVPEPGVRGSSLDGAIRGTGTGTFPDLRRNDRPWARANSSMNSEHDGYRSAGIRAIALASTCRSASPTIGSNSKSPSRWAIIISCMVVRGGVGPLPWRAWV